MNIVENTDSHFKMMNFMVCKLYSNASIGQMNIAFSVKALSPHLRGLPSVKGAQLCTADGRGTKGTKGSQQGGEASLAPRIQGTLCNC